MKYFQTYSSSKIKCLLCSHYCYLKNLQFGVCGVEKNVLGELVNTTYAKPAALNVDPIEKKPLYHFLPSSRSLSLGTFGCNFRCPFCQNWQISQCHHTQSGNNKKILPNDVVNLAKKNGCLSISYTYNEPAVFYPYARDIGVLAKKNGLRNIFVSNAYESKEVINDMKFWVDAINVDLKSFSKNYYKNELKGDLDVVLNNIKELSKGNIWLEITTLVVPGVNDTKEELGNIAQFIANECGVNTPWHLSAFYPNYKMTQTKTTSRKILEYGYDIGKKIGLNYIYLGNIDHDNCTKCPNCNLKLIKRSYFNVTSNILQNSKCPRCLTEIKGVWI